MQLQTIEVTEDAGVITLRLDRPTAANSVDLQMAKDLLTAAEHCASTSGVRAVVLTGKGKMFSGGGDVPAFIAAGDGAGQLLRDITTPLHAAIARFVRMDAPLVVAVNGTAAGAGFSMALAGDVVLAAASAKFTMAYTKIALSPDGSGSFFLPRIVGMVRAKEMMLLNPVLSAEQAAGLGLVTEVVADDALAARAAEVARQLASGPTLAYGKVKRLLADSHHNTLEQQLALEGESISTLGGTTADAREGLAAFTGKRKAQFTGR
jgi:2-(1,2-epoxy-1,2-dihydrophenyl)acetyl-CoA isomerase